MRISLAQINPIVGDIAGNAQLIRGQIHAARAAGARVVVFPEQCLVGYPAKDLLLRRDFIARNLAALDELARETAEIAALVGFAQPNDQAHGRPVFNAAALLEGGSIRTVWRKRLLPTYDVFDEARYFEPAATDQPVIELDGLGIGVSICEDMWSTEEMDGRPLYTGDPLAALAAHGAQLILNISASPFFEGKFAVRHELLRRHARRHRVSIVFVNQVGGNDELVFDGASCALDSAGEVIAQAPAFAADLLSLDFREPSRATRVDLPEDLPSVFEALVLGTRDYVSKCGFTQVVLGLSGGIDSALVAVIAAVALGRENVLGVSMASRYSSEHSVTDAESLAANLGIAYSSVPIAPMHEVLERELRPHFAGRPPDVTEENLQARLRGVTLMALSNKFGRLLLTTANKSELAVGYSTLYGDMCGGLAVISDVLKTDVYRLARWVNETGAGGRMAPATIIPHSTLTKPPSAELRPNQIDRDSLPPYDVLDAILRRHEEGLQGLDQIIAAGFERRIVEDVLRKIQISEYKRRQAAPGLKVTRRAFGFGRRMPIAARYAP